MHNATRSFLPKATAIVTLGLITIVAGFNAVATDVYTDPVGFYKTSCISNSDNVASIAFTRVPEASGLIAAISGSDITISNASYTAGQWTYLGVALQSNHYYVVVTTNSAVGKTFPITNNTANTLSVQLMPEDLTGVSVGDRVQIIPYWTLGSAFPDGAGIIPSASAGTRPTELVIPPFNGTNENQASTTTYYFFTNATVRTFRLVGGGTTSRDNDVLIPDGYFTVRHNVGFGLPSLAQLVQPGSVPLKTQRTVIGRNGSGTTGRDNYIALFRPATMTLSNSLLAQSGAFRPSASAGTRPDELVVQDNTVAGINKAATTTYYFFTNATVSAWRLVGGGTTDRGTNQVFTPGFGVVLRVNNIGNPVSPTTATWVNQPPY